MTTLPVSLLKTLNLDSDNTCIFFEELSFTNPRLISKSLAVYTYLFVTTYVPSFTTTTLLPTTLFPSLSVTLYVTVYTPGSVLSSIVIVEVIFAVSSVSSSSTSVTLTPVITSYV